MHRDIATAPHYPIEFLDEKVERGKKLLVIAAVPHILQFVGVGIEFRERRREYRESDAFIGDFADQLHAVAEVNIATLTPILSGGFGRLQVDSVVEISIHGRRHRRLHLLERFLLCIEAVFYVRHRVGGDEVDIDLLGLSETV